ncbi:hypothetical protein HOY80DRAFT_1081571 [Tuber brumale]|nr:hypothetical protein HOY80DRAFT_1081571 [Tuber brumale]
MNRSDDDSEDSDSDGSKHDADERKAGYRENDGIPTGEDDDIDALGSEWNRFSGFKFLGSSATKEGANDPGDEAILNEEKVSDKDDTSDVDNDFLSPNEDGGGDEGAQDKEAKRWEEPKKLMTEEQLKVVANISKAVKADTEKGTVVNNSRYIAAEDAALNPWNGLTDLRCELCSSSTPEWKRGDTNASTPLLWAKIQKLEAEVYPDSRKSE